MEVKDYIGTEFDHLKHNTDRVLDGISHYESLWRPGPGCNSIGLILFHSARFEDSMIQGQIQGKTPVWEAGKWYQKLNLPVSEETHNYTAEQVVAFSVPDFKDLRAYSEAVRAKTLACLKNISPDKFDRKVKMPWGEFTIGSLFGMIVGHQAEHIGEMSYLRGLQRGMNK